MSNHIAKTRRLTQLSLLIALLAVLTITPLGMIMVPPVAITILHIPVLVGALVLGPMDGAILGFAFGLMSMLKATFSAVSPVDLLFSPFTSGYPLQSLIMCFVPRILLGLLAGLLFKGLQKVVHNQRLAIGISAAIATVCHSLGVLGCLWLFFSALPLRAVFLTIVGVNGLLELGAGVLVSVAVCKPLLAYLTTKD